MKADLANNFVVGPNTQIKLRDWDPDFTGEINKDYADDLLNNKFWNQMSDLQYKLFAYKNQALLIILQGMDASGKDSTVQLDM